MLSCIVDCLSLYVAGAKDEFALYFVEWPYLPGLNKPDLVISQKLSRVGPGLYMDGRPTWENQEAVVVALDVEAKEHASNWLL